MVNYNLEKLTPVSLVSAYNKALELNNQKGEGEGRAYVYITPRGFEALDGQHPDIQHVTLPLLEQMASHFQAFGPQLPEMRRSAVFLEGSGEKAAEVFKRIFGGSTFYVPLSPAPPLPVAGINDPKSEDNQNRLRQW